MSGPSASPQPRHVAMLLPDMRGGGAERVALTLATEFRRRGHRVSLLLGRATGELLPLLPDGVEVRDLQAERIRSMLRPLASHLRRERPDALIAFMWPLTCVAVVAAKLARTRTRVIVTEHATLSRQYAGWGAAHRLALASSIAATYPLAHARVAVSKGAAADLERLGRLRQGSVEVIHNPVPPPILPIEPLPESARKWNGQGPLILSVGTLKPVKNHKLLIEAFARLPRELGAQLVIVGEGPLHSALKEQAEELGIADRVCFPGFAVDPWPYYASADLFVLSSDHEGFANVIVEAFHVGLPVVSTDCPNGPGEILEGGKWGELVHPRDPQALAEAMQRAITRPHDPARSRERARAYDGRSAFAAYERLLFG